MVEAQLRRRGIRDERVLRAMREIPREEFVPAELRVLAYRDEPVHIGYGQTISQPYMTALMAEVLELEGHETVLEVGSGSGYAAAVLGALADRVITVEIVPGLVGIARANLRRTRRDRNVTVVQGDGSIGHPPGAPYDAISVAAGAPEAPPQLVDQLNEAVTTSRSFGSPGNAAAASNGASPRSAGSSRCAAERAGIDAAAGRQGPPENRAQHHRWVAAGARRTAGRQSGDPVCDPRRDSPRARRQRQGQGAGDRAHAERLESYRVERGRPAGAVRQHRLAQGTGRGGVRAGRGYTFSMTFSSPASEVSVE
jgi:protein-L-isoaspartate(D-aspartate) O-methyltransferase